LGLAECGAQVFETQAVKKAQRRGDSPLDAHCRALAAADAYKTKHR